MHAEFRGTNLAGLMVLYRPPGVTESGVDGRPIPMHGFIRITRSCSCSLRSLPPTALAIGMVEMFEAMLPLT